MVWRRGLGFRMRERLAGTHRFRQDLPERQIHAGQGGLLELQVSWGADDLWAFLSPMRREFGRADLTGHITVDGLCRQAPASGTLELRYFQDASLRYRLEFATAGGRFRYLGVKRQIRPWNLHRSHTTCYGEVVDADTGDVISESVIRFDLWQLPAFLASFRLVRGAA